MSIFQSKPIIYSLDLSNTEIDHNSNSVEISEQAKAKLITTYKQWQTNQSYIELQDLKFLLSKSEISYRFVSRPNEHTEINFFDSNDPTRSTIHRTILKTPFPILPGIIINEYTEFFYFDIKPLLNISKTFGNNFEKAFIFNKEEVINKPCKSFGLFKCHFQSQEVTQIWSFT